MSVEVRELEHSMARRTVAYLQGENDVLRARVAELEETLRGIMRRFEWAQDIARAALAQESRTEEK